MVIFKEALLAKFQYAKNTFLHNSFVHFACTKFTINKCNRYFFDLELQFPAGKLHFDLESVSNKMDFIKDYKFVISFENSSNPGYTTEKLIEPMLVNSIPIYWGNTEVGARY